MMTCVAIACLLFPGAAPQPAVTSTSRDPAWSPDGTLIVFSGTRPDGAGLFIMNADGSDVRRVTRTDAMHSYPFFSPDGTRLVFMTYATASSTVDVVNVDGTGHRRLTAEGATSTDPHWTPDGRIAFAARHEDNDDLFVMNADGTGVRRLTNHPAQDITPVPSPDGARILFVTDRDGHEEIYVMDADGGAVRNLSNDPLASLVPSWSPDGRMVAYYTMVPGGGRATSELHVVGLDGTGRRQLTRNEHRDSGPVWSPDGSRIAFTSDRDGSLEVYVMDADGGNVARLTHGDDAPATQDDGVRALDGEWIFVEDRTEGRAVEAQQPSMSARVTLRIEEDALVLVRRDGEIRIALDGSPTDVVFPYGVSRYRGGWKDGAFEYESVRVRESDDAPTGLIRWVLRPTDEGLLASVAVDPPTGFRSDALYRRPQDIAQPEPAPATIDDLAWLAGAWVGTRGATGSTSIEERWSPPLGGAMLGVSRTVSRGSMRAFEFLRVVERDGGLVYVAQPGGRPPTEFVLTELGTRRAVFENPRHDFPQRIVYELPAEGDLSASIGFATGGRPRRFEFGREGK